MKLLKIVFFIFPLLASAQDDMYTSSKRVKRDYTCSEPVNLVDGLVTLIKVSETGKSKEEMYSIVKNWLADIFTRPGNAITFEDKELGRIKGRMTSQQYSDVFGYYNYTLLITFEINVKDNKVRVVYSDITFELPSMSITAESTITDHAIASVKKKHRRTRQMLKYNLFNDFKGFNEGLNKAIDKSKSLSDW